MAQEGSWQVVGKDPAWSHEPLERSCLGQLLLTGGGQCW